MNNRKPLSSANASQAFLVRQTLPSQKNAAQPKMTTTLPARKSPVAPPVYRPQPTPKALQTKQKTHSFTGPIAKQPAAPVVYRPLPSHRCLQTKSATRANENGASAAVRHQTNQLAPVVQRNAANGAIQRFGTAKQNSRDMGLRRTSKESYSPTQKTTNTKRPGQTSAIQRMSFARFWSYGFLSYWGSYNDTENTLLQHERDTQQFLSTLDQRTRQRTKVKQLSTSLAAIVGSTIAESDYDKTLDKLIKIKSELRVEKDTQALLDRLRHNRGVFSERGRPEIPDLPHYPNQIDPLVWTRLIDDMPKKSKKKWRQGQNLDRLVEHLFRKFIAQQFKYQLMSDWPHLLIGTGVTSDTAEGNCLSYAIAFADLLNAFGINAQAQYVRKESQGRFIVKVNDFMDPTVPGHIFLGRVLQRGYYMFASHAATWVPSLHKYYDPMSKSSYTSIDRFIECEITSDKNEQVFYPKTAPKTLNPGQKWKLVRRQKMVNGGFYRMEMKPWTT